MLIFLSGMITGAAVGVICMAIFTAASEADDKAVFMLQRKGIGSENKKEEL